MANMKKNKEDMKEENIKKGKRRRPRKNQGSQTITGANDLSWYVRDDQMLRDSSNLQYFKPLGHRFNLGSKTSFDASTKTLGRSQYIPGFMRIDLISGPGIASEATDPANMAARLLHTEINAKNSRNKSYDPDDLFKYILAIDEAYAFITWLERTYGLITTYSKFNAYYPKAVISSMGFDYDELAINLPNFRILINNWILQLSAFTIPARWSYLTRHHFIYKGVYADSTSSTAQTFAFNPCGFRKYVEDEVSEGKAVPPYLKFIPCANHDKAGLWGLNKIRAYGNDLINALVNSQDALTMSADILKWAQTSGGQVFEGIAPMPEDYAVAPVFDPEVLMQIENTTINAWLEPALANPSGHKIFNITSDPRTCVIKYQPSYMIGSDVKDIITGDRIINMRMSDPKPGDTMIATRLMNIPVADKSNLTFYQAGSEIAIGCYVTSFEYDEDTNELITAHAKSPNYSEMIDNRWHLNNMFSFINLFDKFAYHPPIHFVLDKDWKPMNKNGSQPEDKDCVPKGVRLQELDNITTINQEEIATIHKAAILGMFAF